MLLLLSLLLVNAVAADRSYGYWRWRFVMNFAAVAIVSLSQPHCSYNTAVPVAIATDVATVAAVVLAAVAVATDVDTVALLLQYGGFVADDSNHYQYHCHLLPATTTTNNNNNNNNQQQQQNQQ